RRPRGPARARRLRLHAGIRHPDVRAPGQGLAAGAGRSAQGVPAHCRHAVQPTWDDGKMDFRLGRDRGDDLKAFRAELREVLARYSTPEARSRAISTGTWLDWDLHREMAKRGWIGDDFPKELGGRGNDPVRMIAMREELDLSGAPWLGWIYARMIASSLRAAGSEQQKKEFIPRLLGGEMIACLGYTEPGCGSDVAAAATKARKLE